MKRRRRVNRSEEEWQELVAGFEASGKTQEEYCQEAGLSKTSFQKWHRRLKGRGTSKFIELKPRADFSEKGRAKLEVEVDGGITVRIWS